MYNYIKSIDTKTLLTKDLPIFLVSLLFANAFYHFHSFIFETVAFLATWLSLGGILKGFEKYFPR